MRGSCLVATTMLAAVLLAVFGGPSDAAKLPRYGIFVYSSACTEAESEQAAGDHVVLIREGNGDVLYWYWGPMREPAQAHPVAIDDKTGAISFSVDQVSQTEEKGAQHPSALNPASYRGSISDDAITLDAGNGKTEIIPRVKDFSKKIGPCKPPAPSKP